MRLSVRTVPRRLTLPWVAPQGLHVNGKIGGVPATSALNNMQVQRRRHRHRAVQPGARIRRLVDLGRPRRDDRASDARRRSLRLGGGAANGVLQLEVRRKRFHGRLLRRVARACRVEQPAVHHGRHAVRAVVADGVPRERLLAGRRARDHGRREPRELSAREGRELSRRARHLQHERIGQRVRLGVVPLRFRLDDERQMGHARGRADGRDGEADRHLRRAARRSPVARDRRRRGLRRPARYGNADGLPRSRRRRGSWHGHHRL